MTELHALSALDAARAVAAGETSSVELVRHALGRAEGVGAHVGAFVHLDHEGALARAAEVDAQVAGSPARRHPPRPRSWVRPRP